MSTSISRGDVRILPGASAPSTASPHANSTPDSTTPPASDSLFSAYFPQLAIFGGGLLGGAAGGALLGAKLSGGSVLASLAGGIIGAIGGAGIARGVGHLLSSIGNPDTTPASAMPRTAAPDPKNAPPEDVRVMTLNIHGGMGPGNRPTEASLEKLAQLIEKEDPDVLMLQEVDDFAMRSAWRDQVEWLYRRLAPDGAAFASSGTFVTGRQQGEMVMTFNDFTVDTAQNIASPDPYGNGLLRSAASILGQGAKMIGAVDRPTGIFARYSPRNSADVLVRTPEGREVRAVSTHLSGTLIPDGIVSQITPIHDALADWNGAALVAGDFNAGDTTHGGQLQTEILRKAGLQDAFTGAGIAPGEPERASVPGYSSGIDRIYASDDFDVRSIRVLSDAGVSDHHPVLAEFTLS